MTKDHDRITGILMKPIRDQLENDTGPEDYPHIRALPGDTAMRDEEQETGFRRAVGDSEGMTADEDES